MNGFLFEQIVFGPVKSRRLGISLGVNLLPLNEKHCTFNCLYCECGWTIPGNKSNASYPSRTAVYQALEQRLRAMKQKKSLLDTITFAGNGEPTLHPEFSGIIEDTISLRKTYFPGARIAVLSNASLASDKQVADALKRVDQNILKLDAGTNKTFQIINNPGIDIHLDEVIQNLKQFAGNMIIQTLFVRGSHKGVSFDNTTDHEVSLWLQHIQMLQPKLVMIYPIARATPTEDVEKVPGDVLLSIAARVEALGIPTEVYP